jgi:hypothetical protein
MKPIQTREFLNRQGTQAAWIITAGVHLWSPQLDSAVPFYFSQLVSWSESVNFRSVQIGTESPCWPGIFTRRETAAGIT